MKDIDPATMEAIKCFIKLIDTKYDIFDVILFGSRSRCTHEVDSDIDIAILLKGKPQRMVPVKLSDYA
jgi:predicted nucleotidyltransferase